MSIIPRKTFTHDRLGILEKGVGVAVPDEIGASLIDQGHATAAEGEAGQYNTKVVPQSPSTGRAAKRRAAGKIG